MYGQGSEIPRGKGGTCQHEKYKHKIHTERKRRNDSTNSKPLELSLLRLSLWALLIHPLLRLHVVHRRLLHVPPLWKKVKSHGKTSNEVPSTRGGQTAGTERGAKTAREARQVGRHSVKQRHFKFPTCNLQATCSLILINLHNPIGWELNN